VDEAEDARMIPTDLIMEATSASLAEDVNTLAKALASENKVHLVVGPFVANANTRLEDLTEASFPGYGPLLVGIGPQKEGRDSATGRRKIILKEPAGGWNWEATGVVTPSQTVTGFVVASNDGTETYGSGQLPTPQTVGRAGDLVSVGEVALLLTTNAWE
jgi:hypothetical protein